MLKNLGLLQNSRVALSLLLFALPVSIVAWVPGVWACFFALIILNNTLSGKTNNYFNTVKASYLTKPNNYLLLTCIAYFVFSAGSVFLLNSPLKAIDNALVLLLWLAISPMLATFSLNGRALGYGCLAAVVLALLIAINQFYFLDIKRPYGMYGDGASGSGAIKFGDMSILLGILSFIFLSESPAKKYGVLGSAIGFIVCLYTGARGGIFALLLCMIVWFCYLRDNKLSQRSVLWTVLLGITGFFIIDALMHNALSVRINETVADILSLFNNQLDTSMGIRLQLWKAALIMFENNPVIGVGLNNFDNGLLALNKASLVSDTAAKYAHAHNEYLCALATGGIVGFTLTCLLFFVPIAIFKKDYQQNAWAKAGFWGVCLMAFFALTDCMFDRRMTVIAFALLISVCMSGNVAQKHYKDSPVQG